MRIILSSNKLSKKRTFLLLEVLIALILVGVCLMPLMVRPLEAFRYQRQKLREIEKARVADLSFSEIRLQMKRGKIPWKHLPEKGRGEKCFELTKIPILQGIRGCSSCLLERSFGIICLQEKADSRVITRHLAVRIYLEGERFSKYDLIVRRIE